MTDDPGVQFLREWAAAIAKRPDKYDAELVARARAVTATTTVREEHRDD